MIREVLRESWAQSPAQTVGAVLASRLRERRVDECFGERRVGEAALELTQALPLVEGVAGEVDETDHVVGRAGDGDHGTAVRVTDEQDRALDVGDHGRDVFGIAGEAAVGHGGHADGEPVGEQLGNEGGEAGGVGERPVDEDDGGLGHGELLGGCHWS